MKNAAGTVIYVGKAKNLRARAGSYFLKAAAEERRTADLVREIHDIDFLPAESEVDALLIEARLIKDVQPKYNQDLKDDKTFPVLGNLHPRGFPARRIHPRAAPAGHEAVRPVRQRRQPARRDPGAAKNLQISHLLARYRRARRTLALVPALPAGVDQPVHGPLQLADIERRLPPRYPPAADVSRRAQDAMLLEEMRAEMQAAAAALQFEKAARLRDEIHMLETLDQRGDLDEHAQPEVFYIDPKKGLAGLRKVLQAATSAAHHRRRRHCPFGRRRNRRQPGAVHRWAAVQAGLQAVQDSRRRGHRRLRQHPRSRGPAVPAAVGRGAKPFPDILLVDGGKGQLNAALAAFARWSITPPTVISLAKREEEIYIPGADEPLRLSRHAYALRLLQYVRDEAHRFAQHYHHLLRRKSTLGE